LLLTLGFTNNPEVGTIGHNTGSTERFPDHIAMDLWMIGFSLFMESIRSEAKSIIYGLLE
jgi:hypothetical protein